jgi:hypothetical protein
LSILNETYPYNINLSINRWEINCVKNLGHAFLEYLGYIIFWPSLYLAGDIRQIMQASALSKSKECIEGLISKNCNHNPHVFCYINCQPIGSFFLCCNILAFYLELTVLLLLYKKNGKPSQTTVTHTAPIFCWLYSRMNACYAIHPLTKILKSIRFQIISWFHNEILNIMFQRHHITMQILYYHYHSNYPSPRHSYSARLKKVLHVFCYSQEGIHFLCIL